MLRVNTMNLQYALWGLIAISGWLSTCSICSGFASLRKSYAVLLWVNKRSYHQYYMATPVREISFFSWAWWLVSSNLGAFTAEYEVHVGV